MPLNSELVFLSAKSEDYKYANRVYEYLQENGIHVFFSEQSLPELGNSDYRKMIDEKLDQCRHMVVVASSRKNVEAEWVEAEWGFFINAKRAMEKDGNIITVAVGDLKASQLPPSLRYYEVIPFRDDSLYKIIKYINPSDLKAPQKKNDPVSIVAPEEKSSFLAEPKIKVIGVGGSGQTLIEQLIATNNHLATVYISTDQQAINASHADIKILIGETLTKGLGVGGNPELAREAAQVDRDKIIKELSGRDVLLLSTGLGGGTGSGAAPVIAQLARDLGILTICTAAMPFRFEGRQRVSRAKKALKLLEETCDVVIPISPDHFRHTNASLDTLFKEVSIFSCHLINAVNGLLSQNGLINIDFADLRTIFQNSGIGGVGQSTAHGKDRAQKAVREAIKVISTSYENVENARALAIVLESMNPSFDEFHKATETIYEFFSDEVNVIFNHITTNDVEEGFRATIIGTGIGFDF